MPLTFITASQNVYGEHFCAALTLTVENLMSTTDNRSKSISVGRPHFSFIDIAAFVVQFVDREGCNAEAGSVWLTLKTNLTPLFSGRAEGTDSMPIAWMTRIDYKAPGSGCYSAG